MSYQSFLSLSPSPQSGIIGGLLAARDICHLKACGTRGGKGPMNEGKNGWLTATLMPQCHTFARHPGSVHAAPPWCPLPTPHRGDAGQRPTSTRTLGLNHTGCLTSRLCYDASGEAGVCLSEHLLACNLVTISQNDDINFPFLLNLLGWHRVIKSCKF